MKLELLCLHFYRNIRNPTKQTALRVNLNEKGKSSDGTLADKISKLVVRIVNGHLIKSSGMSRMIKPAFLW